MDVTVRLAGPADEEALADLTSRTSDGGAVQFTHDLLVTPHEAALARDPATAHLLAVDAGGAVVGSAALTPSRSPTTAGPSPSSGSARCRSTQPPGDVAWPVP